MNTLTLTLCLYLGLLEFTPEQSLRIKPKLRLIRPEAFKCAPWVSWCSGIWWQNEKDVWSDRPFGEPRSFFVEDKS
jgi:hypothetical protein